jgi:hypothetical protein
METFYVDSANGVDSTANERGTASDNAWATLDYAVDNISGESCLIFLMDNIDEQVTLGANANGKTILVKSLWGPSTVTWDYNSESSNSTLRILAGANGFSLTFEDLTITRTSCNGNCSLVDQENAGGAAKAVNFTNCNINHPRFIARILAGGSSDALSMTFTSCTILHGKNILYSGLNLYFGDIVFDDTTIGESAADGGIGQEHLFVFTTADSVASLTIRNGCVFTQESRRDTDYTVLDTTDAVVDVTLDDSTFTYTVNAYTEGKSPIYIDASGDVSITDCTFTDEIGGASTPGGTFGHHWIDATAGGGLTFTGNTLTVFSATSDNAQYYAADLQGETGLDVTGNTVTSGASGINANCGATASVAADVSSNVVNLINTGETANPPYGIAVGEAADTATDGLFGASTINSNQVTCSGTKHGILLLVGVNFRNGSAGSPGTEIAHNKLVSTQGTAVGTAYGLYNRAINFHEHRNEVCSRAPLVHVGARGATIEYNSAYALDQNAKGPLFFGAHIEGHTGVDNTVRYNVIAIGDGEEVAGAYILTDADTEFGMVDCLFDHNYYAAVSSVGLATLNEETITYDTDDPTTLALLQALWVSLESEANFSGVTGNDANSHYSTSPEVFEDPTSGDFTPTRFLFGLGANEYPNPQSGAGFGFGTKIGI